MAHVIDVAEALASIPHFATFCSLEKLHALVRSLVTDVRFTVTEAGASLMGRPIHHVRVGAGPLRAMVVAGPHCPEQIGGMTAYSLLSLLKDGSISDENVEWHIIPCADPDGALLNEGWSQEPFNLPLFMRNYYVQPPADQVDLSFPFSYNGVSFDRPSTEARVLKKIIDQVRPDFFYSLHNSFIAGGTWFGISRNIGPKCHQQLRDLLKEYAVPLQVNGPISRSSEVFADGIVRMPTSRMYYKRLEEQGMSLPEPFRRGETGTGSPGYLEETQPGSLTFVTELTYTTHPDDFAADQIEDNLRRIRLQVIADNTFIASVIVDEWTRVEADLDKSHPFYKKIFTELIGPKGNLHERLPHSWGMAGLRNTLASPADNRLATRGERFSAHMYRFQFLCNAYVFVRLLKVSKPTVPVQTSLERMEALFTRLLQELDLLMDFRKFAAIDCDTLARVQLGSGLIVLNSLLEVPPDRPARAAFALD